MDSDELSLETTAPTDLSLSGDELALKRQKERKRHIGRQLIERKQLLHDLQVQKIELSQKSLVIDNLKADHLQKTEDLEENLNRALHEKNILQAKLESQLKIQQDEAKRRQDLIKRELDTILARQQQLEATNHRLQEKAGNVKKSFLDTEITEEHYKELKTKNEDDLALKDFFAVKVYECLYPWKTENQDISSRLQIITAELSKCKLDYNRLIGLLEDEKRSHQELQQKYQRTTLNLADVQGQVRQGNYKVENYDHVKKERDELETDHLDLKKQYAYLESSHQATVSEREALSSELSSLKQSLSLLNQDKTFYSRQVTDYSSKLSYAEERIVQLNDQLEKAKQSREELYEKYVASRDQYKNEYERKLHEELDLIRTKTNAEVDRLKTSTKEMYERENRNLREAREMAASERDRALANEREINSKYEQLAEDLRHLRVTGDNRLSELQNDVKLKSFEAERTQLVYEETVRTLKETQLDLEKKQTKLDILTKEYYTLQTSLEKQVIELESTLRDKNIRLETYEKLEQELDDVVMQAADVENEEEAERVLFSYGYGANVPTTSKRRLQQSVHLARRVLALERTNTSMKKDMERQTVKNQQLAEELKKTNDLLDQSQQPYHYLIESLRVRDSTIAKQKQQIEILEKDIKQLRQEATKLCKGKNQMSADLERLLNQKEEVSVLKQVVTNLREKRRTAKDSIKPWAVSGIDGEKRNKKTTTGKQVKIYEAERDENVLQPPALRINPEELPGWYEKMKKKSKVGKP